MEDQTPYKTKPKDPEISGDYWYDKFCESQEAIAILHRKKHELKNVLLNVIDSSNKCTYCTSDKHEFNAHADLIKATNEAKEILKS